MKSLFDGMKFRYERIALDGGIRFYGEISQDAIFQIYKHLDWADLLQLREEPLTASDFLLDLELLFRKAEQVASPAPQRGGETGEGSK